MKKLRTKEFRISKAESKLKRKAKMMYQGNWYVEREKISFGEFLNNVLKGKKCYTWMRSKNSPCSCYICKGYNKYKRETNKTTNYYLNKEFYY